MKHLLQSKRSSATMILLTIATLTVLLHPCLTTTPTKYGTMTLSYIPDSALTIKGGDTQIFRAPLCNDVNNWSFKAKVYVLNEPWDAEKVGDDTWLHIKVSNRPDMTRIVRDNVRDATPGADPQPFTKPFTYKSTTWGSDAIYIQITARQGIPTFQYGLELSVSPPRDGIPDGMDAVQTVPENLALAKSRDIQTLEQISIPFVDALRSGDTGQYRVPICFEDTYDQRSLTVTTLVSEAVNEAPGGVASFLCTSSMMRNKICWRSSATNRGIKFFDPSGGKQNTVTTTVPKEEYGSIYLLVLAQGNYRENVEFTITTKLRSPHKDTLKLTGEPEKDLPSLVTYLRSIYEGKAPPLNHHFVPYELRQEL